MRKYAVIQFLVLWLFVLLAAAYGETTPPVVYEVTASSLKVRADTNTTAKVLYTIPKGSYVLDAGQDSTKPDTIDGIQGNWIAQFDGYVFSGYLKPTKRPIMENNLTCALKQNAFECMNDDGSKRNFAFSSSTPLSGSWLRYDDATGCKIISAPNVFEKQHKSLKAALSYGDVYWVYEPNAQGGIILQFIVRVRGRGGC